MEPSAAALRGPAFGNAVVHTLSSALGHLRFEEYIVPRFVNLVLMSAVLCAAVTRTGSIWLAAGLHAGWVLIKKINAVISDSAYHHPLQAWLGARSDYLDAWGCTVILLALLAWLLRPGPSPDGQSPAMASQT
ncbi:MAG: CPBP family intramembrane glutamic endopeptidase [Kiritimatiellia bacterium]